MVVEHWEATAWEINGELSALDRQNLMQLLCQVDKQACIDDVGIAPAADIEGN